jgi:signal transduction histidine kinase
MDDYIGQSNRKNILIVDDEEIIRKSCALALERAGYQPMMADNGITALQLLTKHNCDIILLDLKMPLMGGFELLRDLKRNYPHIQVIIMTGYATIETAINAMKEGAFDFVLKPFKADQLKVMVDRCAKHLDRDLEIQDLKFANQKLHELQEMKDKFIAITSHELRTPVSHIKGYLTILNDESYPIKDGERQEFMNIINTAVSDLENIVHNMFDVLQLEKGQLVLNVEAFSIDQLLKQLVHEFQLTLNERKLDLIAISIRSPIELEGDRPRLKQVFSELIQNAIKYTNDGGQIEITADTQDGYCIVKIIDTGVGIQESEQSKIFEKFYEIQNSDYHSSSKVNFLGGGLGLGLTISKAIVEAHCGRIIVESKPNQGSIFTVMLPLEYKSELNNREE